MFNSIKKNFQRVMDGWDDMLEEWAEQTPKIKSAVERKDWRAALHHVSGYREAAQQHLYKVWFYLFWPRRIFEVWLIIYLIRG